ncbi:hypothetical protein DRJ04_04920 [Candidatus Aerophobetes bacterium]|mgnify:CR=1 FL=1|uniref:Probable membrane transporter protein n=1 Tax=Aerophobetes bacterium TaxID=2030807 RepID=A0A662DCD1_UNCAE|nr:MAG: hypothetical protein DRJ04_04920 [Candidatus Aerophobetes bacterium]
MVFQILPLCVIAFFAATVGSMVGGSTLITVPALILFGIPPHQAIGTSRFSTTFLALSSSANYIRNKKVNLHQALLFALIMSTGAILGANVVIRTRPEVIKTIISILIILTAFFMLIRRESGLKQKMVNFTAKRKIMAALLAFSLGVYGGFFGGIGPFLIASFIFFMGSTFLQARGNSSLIGFIWSSLATVVFLRNNLVIFKIAIPLSISMILGAWIGSSFALKIGNLWVRRLFIVFIIILAIKTAFS